MEREARFFVSLILCGFDSLCLCVLFLLFVAHVCASLFLSFCVFVVWVYGVSEVLGFVVSLCVSVVLLLGFVRCRSRGFFDAVCPRFFASLCVNCMRSFHCLMCFAASAFLRFFVWFRFAFLCFSVRALLLHSLQQPPGAEKILWTSFSLFWVPAPPEHSQQPKSYNIDSKSLLEVRGHFGYHFPCVGCLLCRSILSYQKVVLHSIQKPSGAGCLEPSWYFGRRFLRFGCLLRRSRNWGAN